MGDFIYILQIPHLHTRRGLERNMWGYIFGKEDGRWRETEDIWRVRGRWKENAGGIAQLLTHYLWRETDGREG